MTAITITRTDSPSRTPRAFVGSSVAEALSDESVLTTIQAAELASRRRVRAAERRRQRYVTVICSAMVTAGASGTFAFASMLVAR